MTSIAPLPRQPSSRRSLGIIGAIVLALAGAFAFVAGWLTPRRLTPQRLVDAFEADTGKFPGYRRAHAEGICIRGEFHANGEGARLSRAAVFAPGATAPVVGRLAVAAGNPHRPDAAEAIRSMALRLSSADGQEWRTGMNSTPFHSISTPEGLYAEYLAQRPDPATGKPDPAQLQAFAAAHPESVRFRQWLDGFVPSDSYANSRFYSVNAFRFVNAAGTVRHVRWTLQPEAGYAPLDRDHVDGLGLHFLRDELRQRLAQGPLRWQLIVSIAAPGDPVDDPAQAWPAQRPQIHVGTLVITEATPQATGACRDLNFDPLILPTGMAASDDPVLRARSAGYAVSYRRRSAELATGAEVQP
jgi:catalase